jgi:ADP-ribose pyrophosphatase YjhB (NUDIX family)
MRAAFSWLRRKPSKRKGATSADEVKPLVMAAGGLVWRATEEARQLAIVHRPQYGDWTLPKGKLEPGEGYEAAARREVKEETGYEVALGPFAGTISYTVNGAPKVVLFWHMHVRDDHPSGRAPDVDEVVWLSAREAVERLSHRAEKVLVMETATDAQAPRSLRHRLKGAIKSWAADDRLAGSLAAYPVELDRLIRECAADGKGTSSWADASRRLVEHARAAVDSGEREAGWQCLLAAQRMEVFGLAQCRTGALESRAQVVLAEGSSKLGGWRKTAVERLLAKDGALRAGVEAVEVFAATQVLHEHFNNVYRRLRITYMQLGVLALVGAAALIIWLLLGPPVPSRESASPADLQGMASAVVLLGVLGACVSGILSLARESTVKRIPEHLLALTVTACRPIVGAIAALAIYIFALSPLVSRLFTDAVTPTLVLFLGFASGASERLIDRAVRAAEQESSTSEKK